MARKPTLWSCVGTAFLLISAQSIKADGGGCYRRYSKTALTDAAGQNVGNAIIHSFPTESLVQINLRHLPAGRYSLALHSGNTCTAPDFGSAGGPLNLSWRPEEGGDPGRWNASSSPIEVLVASNGKGHKEQFIPHIGLVGARSVVGRTFIVSELSSAAKKRVACGTIAPST